MDKEDFKYALPVGTLLRSPNREYRIEKVLGVGGFGITYKVSATLVYQNVPIFTYFAVKEHFLKDACERDAGSAGVVYSRPSKARVEESRKDFLSEAERLNALSGQVDNIVPVSEVFEANNTVYYVMEYLNGGSLSDIVKAGGPLPEQRASHVDGACAGLQRRLCSGGAICRTQHVCAASRCLRSRCHALLHACGQGSGNRH